MKIKPSVPKGMRDFLPMEVAKRQFIIDKIEFVFQHFGFQSIYTPVMENLNTLTGKYGDEGDKLLFKVLNNGDFLDGVNQDDLNAADSKKVVHQISSKGLRYDLTVPLARYVVQHQNELTFPFRRYHIAPVWRGDRPQKGRYKEFYQCDADVIGSASLLNEVEMVQMYHQVFEQLNVNVTIKYNSRKLLIGLMQQMGLENHTTQAITILDKADKVGIDKVLSELVDLGLPTNKVDDFKKIVQENKLELLADTTLINAGKEEVKAITEAGIENAVLDLSLARGLDYYTGCIFEVVVNDFDIGSVGGGGRYDNLTELFGKSDMTGVGISFGLDRIYDVLEGQNKFPETMMAASQVMIAHFDETSQNYGFKQLGKLRKAGVKSEIYPDVAKFQKQMKYADNKGIPYVIIIGEEEMASGLLNLKNMKTGEQKELSTEDIIDLLKVNLL